MEYQLLPSKPPITSLRLVNRLRLKHWALLSALGDSATLNNAAAAVSVTQPSATKMLADIEQAFGALLFERHSRGLRATPLGEQVIVYARQTQMSLQRFVEDLEVKRRGGYGQLVVGAIMGAAPDMVAHAVARMKRERPMLNIRIVGDTSDQISALLYRGELDLAIGRFSTPLQHNSFDFEPLSRETLQVLVRSDHPLARKRKLSLSQLSDYPWVLQPIAIPTRLAVEEEFSRAKLATPRNLVECTSIFATLQLVQVTDAVTVLPESVARDHVKAALLRALPLAIGQKLDSFGVLKRRDDVLSDAASVFVTYLRSFASKEHRGG